MRRDQVDRMTIAVVMTALYIILIFAIVGLAFVVYEFAKWWTALP